ncbi:MAG: hypothetical protein AB1393_04655 [Candidatus Edwardsbacteria bacterium]
MGDVLSPFFAEIIPREIHRKEEIQIAECLNCGLGSKDPEATQ